MNKKKIIGLRVPDDIFNALHEEANRQGITMSQMLMPAVCRTIGAEYHPEQIKFFKPRQKEN